MDEERLREELELAAMEVWDGAPAGPLQASRVRRAIGDVLRKNRLQGHIEVLHGGQAARITLAPRAPRARQLVIQLVIG